MEHDQNADFCTLGSFYPFPRDCDRSSWEVSFGLPWPLLGLQGTNLPSVASDVLTSPFQLLDLVMFLKANEVGLAPDCY